MIVQDLFGVAMSKHLTTWGSILFGDDEVYFNIYSDEDHQKKKGNW